MQPYINQVNNFDALQDYVLEYTYLGSERVLTNEVSIREDVKYSQPVYTRQSTKFDKNHKISGGSLINGKNYLIKLRVRLGTLEDEEGGWSDWSPELRFVCLATPTFIFSNLDKNGYVYNNDVMMQVIYRQEQGEKVDTYQFSLLDQNKSPLTVFPTRTPNEISPNVLEERFNNLVKGRLYYIKCQVVTKNGINFFDTHQFIPHFASPSLDGIVETMNQPESGQVLVQSFLKQTLGIQTRPFVIGSKNNDANNYTYLANEWVVIPQDKPLKYTSLGMAKASDWVAKIWCKNIVNGLFLDFEREDGNGVGLKFFKYNDYITCEKSYLGIKSRTISNIVPGLKLKEFYLYIRVVEFRILMKIVPKEG